MEEIRIEYEHEYYHAGMTSMLNEKIPELIGKADAIDEWVDPSTARANFIKIDSYDEFADPTCVFLVGRIGSGKTAMLSRLNYSIEHKKNGDYSNSALIDTRDYIAQMGKIIRIAGMADINYSEIEYTARKEWEKMLYTVAMKKMYDLYAGAAPDRFYKMKAYLEEQGILTSPKISVSKVLQIIAEKMGMSESAPGQGIASAANILGQITSPTYASAVAELESALELYGNIVILVDSIEQYEFNDKVVLAILNSLVNLCLDLVRGKQNITVKMAAPSELIPKLTAINPEKMAGKIVYIRWSTTDLKTFIAVRVYKYVNRIEGKEKVNQSVANHFFDEYYSEVCMTRCGFYFPTFPYCLSYTQKEPRQVISIFNTWLHYEESYPHRPRMELINDAITHDELTRVNGALSIYKSVHTEIFEMFKRTFNGRKYCFSESDFDTWLNACASIRDSVDAYDLKRYFISSGLVGTMVEMHFIEKGHSLFQNKKLIRVKEVIFEYQYKECLPFNSNTLFCLHPMVFGALNIEVDKNTLVYPKPVEHDSDYIPWA